MGRYYSGDIEGKFWFGVQSSDDASFFGGQQYEPNHVNYEFTDDDLPSIKEGIKKCEDALGENTAKLDKFFAEHGLYNDTMLATYLGIRLTKAMKHSSLIPPVSRMLEWYARQELGKKILHCVEKSGSCSFEAEL